MKLLSLSAGFVMMSTILSATAGNVTLSASTGTMPVVMRVGNIISGVTCSGPSVGPSKKIAVFSKTANKAKCNFPAGFEISGPGGVGAILIKAKGIAKTACVTIIQSNNNIVITSVGGANCALPPSEQLLKLNKLK